MKNNYQQRMELKKIFLTSERAYLARLRKYPEFNETVNALSVNYSDERLFEMAVESISSIELGEVKAEDLGRKEAEIICYLCAMGDPVNTKEKVSYADDTKPKPSKAGNTNRNFYQEYDMGR